MEFTFDEFTMIINALISMNKLNRNIHAKQSRMLSINNWAKLYCTIRINIGRQTGKSTSIINIVNDDDIIIIHDYALREYYRKCKSNVICAKDIKNMKGRNKTFTRIFIDEPNLVFKIISYDEILNMLCCNTEQTYLLIGE